MLISRLLHNRYELARSGFTSDTAKYIENYLHWFVKCFLIYVHLNVTNVLRDHGIHVIYDVAEIQINVDLNENQTKTEK